MSGRVARRYAKALFALARDGAALDTVAAELAELRNAFADPAVATVLASPMMTPARLASLAKQLAGRFRVSELCARFLGVLAENHRLDQLPGIYDHFEVLYDRALHRTRVTIRTAAPLASARQAEIVAAFEHLTGKTVLPAVEIDPALLGGVVVEAEGTVYDGSLRTQLDHLAREITGARTYL